MSIRQYIEYDREELLEFTDEDIKKMIDLECAISGVPLLPQEPERVESFTVGPDVIVHEVAGFYFKSKEDADAVADEINKRTTLDVGCDWQLDRLNYIDGFRTEGAIVVPKQVYSKGLYDETKSERAKIKALTETRDKLKTEYDNVLGRRESIAEEVWGAVNDARQWRDLKAVALARYGEYLQMADGDIMQARKFFAAAYPGDVVHLPDLLPEAKDELPCEDEFCQP